MNHDETSSVGPSALTRLAMDARAWTGSAEQALDLRARVRTLQDGLRPTTGDEQTICKWQAAYRKKKPPSVAWLGVRENAVASGPFLGDESVGTWGFENASEMSDTDGIQWLSALESIPHWTPTPAIRALLWTHYRVLPRTLWVPAARVLARLSLYDEETRACLAADWRALFPKGLAAGKWPNGRLPSAPQGSALGRIRHVLVAASAYIAVGGDAAIFPGFDVARLLANGLPTEDGADASSVLIAWRFLTRSSTWRQAVASSVVRFAESVPENAQAEEALRDLHDALSDAEDEPARAAAMARLAAPRWENARKVDRVEALWSWAQTAQWMKRGRHIDALARLEAAAGAARRLVGFAVDSPVPTALDSLLMGVRLVLTDCLWNTTSEADRVLVCAELFVLGADPTLAELNWPDVLERACGVAAAAEAVPGTVGLAGLAHLAGRLADRGIPSEVFFRPLTLPSDVLLGTCDGRDRRDRALVGRQSKPVAIQAAVQLERHLRAAQSRVARFRLLWRVLRLDPPTKLFDELINQLRDKSATGPQALIECLRDLDSAREGPISLVKQRLRVVADASRRYLAPEPPGPLGAEILDHLAGCLDQLDQRPDVETWKDPEWDLVRQVVRGDEHGGVVRWSEWLDGSTGAVTAAPVKSLRDRLHEPWAELDQSYRDIRHADSEPTHEQLRRLTQGLGNVRAVLATTGWPDVLGARCCLDRLDAWAADHRSRLQQRERGSERLADSMAREDEAGCRAYLPGGPRAAELDQVSHSSIRRLHGFFLRRWLFADAARLSKREPTLNLPSRHRHLLNMYVGVLSGPFLMADIGTAWNWVASPGHPAELWITVGFALLGSLAVVLGQVRGALNSESRLTPVKRVLPTWFMSVVMSFLTSAVALFTLRGGSAVDNLPENGIAWQAILLWGALSAFFGVFLGVMAQGRNVSGD